MKIHLLQVKCFRQWSRGNIEYPFRFWVAFFFFPRVGKEILPKEVF